MAILFHSLLLAQAEAPAPVPGQEDTTGFFRMMLPLLFIFGLFYIMFILPQKKKERELRAAIQSVKENDRVVTIGGIYGVVTNVQRDAERVTIRVDEATGTKLRLNMSAIARVLSAEDQDSSSPAGGKA